MDVQQFFESISEIDVFHVFEGAGYNRLLSFELARLCTRRIAVVRRYRKARWQNRRTSGPITGYFVEKRIGHLPQGAPTSPMLANLAVRDLDAAFRVLADEYGCVYSRYADDLVFSTQSLQFDRIRARDLVRRVYDAMNAHGLRPHTAKTRICPPGARKIVLGLLVDGDRVRLSRPFRSRVEIHLHCLKVVGAARHAERRKFDSIWGLRRHVDGLVTFAESIDRELGSRWRARLDEIPWPV